MSESKSLIDELCEAIKESGARVVFWVCPKGCNGRVTWNHSKPKSVATCQVCGCTSEDAKETP
jgi:hypothetical protein